MTTTIVTPGHVSSRREGDGLGSGIKAYLTVRQGDGAGKHYVIRLGQRFVLGRGRDVTIQIGEHTVSRRHALLELTPQGLRVTDLESRNGTYLNDNQLQPQRLEWVWPGDEIRLGEVFTLLVLHVGTRDRQDHQDQPTRLGIPQSLLELTEFEPLGEIGRGANGIVYSAHQRLLDRKVAIKVPRYDLSDAEARQRFLREVKFSCQVDSPFVVSIYDIRKVGERIYMVMELVNGSSLKDRLLNGPLPILDALAIAEDVARALQAAHSAGIVHRDVKPSNVLLTPEGRAKLSDFGIALHLDSRENAEIVSGRGVGTLSYVSPEQAQNAGTVTPSSDIYSLGATLYALIAGYPPFQPRNLIELWQTFDAPAPPLAFARSDCPFEVAELVHELLAKDPAARPETAAIVAARLSDLRRALEHGADTPSSELIRTDKANRDQIRQALRKRAQLREEATE